MAVAPGRAGHDNRIQRIAQTVGHEPARVVVAAHRVQQGRSARLVEGRPGSGLHIADMHVVDGGFRAFPRQGDAIRQPGQVDHDQSPADLAADVGVAHPAPSCAVEPLQYLDVAPDGRIPGDMAHLERLTRVRDVKHRQTVTEADQRVFACGIEIDEPPDVRPILRFARHVSEGDMRQQVHLVAGVGVGAVVDAGDIRRASQHRAERHALPTVETLAIHDDMEALGAESVAEQQRHADQRRLVARRRLAQEMIEAVESAPDLDRPVHEVGCVVEVGDRIGSAGDADPVGLARHRQCVLDRAAGAHGQRTVSVVLALRGDIAQGRVVGRCPDRPAGSGRDGHPRDRYRADTECMSTAALLHQLRRCSSTVPSSNLTGRLPHQGGEPGSRDVRQQRWPDQGLAP